MRLALSGYGGPTSPMVLSLQNGVPFVKADYVAQGFTNYTVYCIGASGGRGGDARYENANANLWRFYYGGGGGGGGLHKVSGLLSSLPASCPVVVGTKGADGANGGTNPAASTDGSDGGASSFNTNTAKASGGKGGKRVFSVTLTESSGANGGVGGIGGTTVAGGGVAGGVAGTLDSSGNMSVANSPGAVGTFNGITGSGGGGGAGPVRGRVLGSWGPDPGDPNNPSGSPVGGYIYATIDGSLGGDGAYTENQDYLVRTPKLSLAVWADVYFGGGAKLSSVTFDPLSYGTNGNGKVVIVLTQE